MSEINPKLLEALKQRNINVNFNVGKSSNEILSNNSLLSSRSLTTRDVDLKQSSNFSHSDKKHPHEIPHSPTRVQATASFQTPSIRSSMLRPRTADGLNRIISPRSELRSKAKIDAKTPEDESNSKDSQLQRLKKSSTTLHGWRISHHHGTHTSIDENEENFEDEFLRNLDYLSSDALAEMLSVSESDLRTIKSIEFKADLTYSSLSNPGEILSSLVELKLNNSIMASLRDIGSTFQRLEILWVSNCSLKELAGVNSFPNLTELYASYNLIEDVSDLMFAAKLTVLDLEGNEIREMENLRNLSGLENLTRLSIAANPFASNDSSYKKKIIDLLPQVKFIDDEDVDSIQKSASDVSGESQEKFDSKVNDYCEELIRKIERLDVISSNELRASVSDLLKKAELAEPDDETLLTMTIKKHHTKANEVFETKATRLRDGNLQLQENFGHSNLMKRPSTAKSATKMPIKAKTNSDQNIFSAYSELTHNTNECFSGNPLKAMRHKHHNIFTDTRQIGEGESVTLSKNILELFDEFAHFTRKQEPLPSSQLYDNDDSDDRPTDFQNQSHLEYSQAPSSFRSNDNGAKTELLGTPEVTSSHLIV